VSEYTHQEHNKENTQTTHILTTAAAAIQRPAVLQQGAAFL
jgi:hypothetical protein